jgi:zinc/manganese transport system substrate-binding protein
MLLRRTMLALLAGLPVAASATAGAADAPLKVVASFSILGDMVREIGGNHVDLTTLVGPNGDAHVYEPTPADAKTIAAAGLLVVNGFEFESWLPRLIEASGFDGKTVVASRGVSPRPIDGRHEEHAETGDEGHEHHHGADDPHAWQDLANGVIYARNIGMGLAAADPANAAEYARSTDAYVARLQALDAEVKAKLALIPVDRRTVVTSHDAFGYFGDAYGVTFGFGCGRREDHRSDPAREHQRRVRREHLQYQDDRPDHPGDRCRDRRGSLFRCPVGPDRRRPDLRKDVRMERPAAHPRHGRQLIGL